MERSVSHPVSSRQGILIRDNERRRMSEDIDQLAYARSLLDDHAQGDH